MLYLKFTTVLILSLYQFSLSAENLTKDTLNKDSIGFLNIYQDQRLHRLLETDSLINAQKRSFTGYRVQIFFGGSTDKKKAFRVRDEFLERFPHERAYVIYTAPDFRVRVGNFRTKQESIALYKACLRYYPSCYPVKTEILFSDLKPPEEETEVEDSTEIPLNNYLRTLEQNE